MLRSHRWLDGVRNPISVIPVFWERNTNIRAVEQEIVGSEPVYNSTMQHNKFKMCMQEMESFKSIATAARKIISKEFMTF